MKDSTDTSGSSDSSDKRAPRRTKIVSKRPKVDSNVVVVPTVEKLLENGLCVIGNELAKYASKTGKGISLDLKEARVVQAYMDALCKLSREDRERRRSEDLSELSSEELVQLANEIHKSSKKE